MQVIQQEPPLLSHKHLQSNLNQRWYMLQANQLLMHILQLQALVCLTTVDAKSLLGNGGMVFVIGLRICIRRAIAPHAACMECTFLLKVSCIVSWILINLICVPFLPTE